MKRIRPPASVSLASTMKSAADMLESAWTWRERRPMSFSCMRIKPSQAACCSGVSQRGVAFMDQAYRGHRHVLHTADAAGTGDCPEHAGLLAPLAILMDCGLWRLSQKGPGSQSHIDRSGVQSSSAGPAGTACGRGLRAANRILLPLAPGSSIPRPGRIAQNEAASRPPEPAEVSRRRWPPVALQPHLSLTRRHCRCRAHCIG